MKYLIRRWLNWTGDLSTRYGWTTVDVSSVLFVLSQFSPEALERLNREKPQDEETAVFLRTLFAHTLQRKYEACFPQDQSEKMVGVVKDRIRMSAFRNDQRFLNPGEVLEIIGKVHDEAHQEQGDSDGAPQLPESVRSLLERMGLDPSEAVMVQVDKNNLN